MFPQSPRPTPLANKHTHRQRERETHIPPKKKRKGNVGNNKKKETAKTKKQNPRNVVSPSHNFKACNENILNQTQSYEPPQGNQI